MRNGLFRKILLIAAGSVFLFSAPVVLKHRAEMKSSEEHTAAIVEMAVVPTLSADEIPPANESGSSEERYPAETENPRAVAPIRVDFDVLCEKYPDVVAWLYCPDTPINYPVVQSADNAYYLRRLPDGKKNTAGSLFLDYRNSADLSDWNSVIYGHNMTNDTMFGSLTDYQSQAYFDAHPELFLLTPEQDYVINVAAGFVTPADSEIYSSFSQHESNRTQLITHWMESSDFVSGIEPSAEDHLITLSTCSYEYNNARYVLVGVLEKLSRR